MSESQTRLILVCLGILLGGMADISATRPAATRAPQAQNGAAPDVQPRAIIDKYCITCHNQRLEVAKLTLDTADLSDIPARPDIWEKVIAKLRAGLMPPAGRPRPEAEAVSELIGFLEADLDRAAEAAPNPGRTETFHRMNRAEYGNAVRDLLGVHVDATALLPADDASYGFDNIAGVLTISQSHMEQYLTAARRISRAAIGSPPAAPLVVEYRVPESTQQYDRIEGLPFGTRGGMLVWHDFPQDGEYELRILLMCRRGGECDGSAGFADEHHLEVLVDGYEVKRFTLEPRRYFRPTDERIWRVRVPLKAGPHDVGVTFEKLPSIREIDSAYQRFLRPYFADGIIAQPHQTIYQPYLDVVTIVGPFQAAGTGETPSRERVFSCYPQHRSDEESCAGSILRTLTRRAYRRPVTSEDVAPLLAVYRENAAEGGFEGRY